MARWGLHAMLRMDTIKSMSRGERRCPTTPPASLYALNASTATPGHLGTIQASHHQAGGEKRQEGVKMSRGGR